MFPTDTMETEAEKSVSVTTKKTSNTLFIRLPFLPVKIHVRIIKQRVFHGAKLIHLICRREHIP